MKLLLIDTASRNKLYPLTLTRATADIRMGIFTLREKWHKLTGHAVEVITEPYLQQLYGGFTNGEYLLIDSALRPGKALATQICNLAAGHALADEYGWVAGRTILKSAPVYTMEMLPLFKNVTTIERIDRLDATYKIFQWNEEMLAGDIDLLDKTSLVNPAAFQAHFTNPSAVYIEEGAVIEHCHINSSQGPVYIGKQAVIMQGALIRGPFALCEGSVIKMGAKIYGATTIGPYCTAGGEIKNSVLTGYSNKAHDGYLGDSVLGEWCNLGAGTTTSNVKNTAGEVKLYSYDDDQLISAGNKCGLVMGDYSRAAINTCFNTGTVVGISCNVFGIGLTPKFIPDFLWGMHAGQPYQLAKAITDIQNWMRFKNIQLTGAAINVLKHIFEQHVP